MGVPSARSSTDRTGDFYSSDVGSIPAGRTIIDISRLTGNKVICYTVETVVKKYQGESGGIGIHN